MCRCPFAISHFPTLIKKSCWPSFTSRSLLARQHLPTPVEKKLVFIDVFEASGSLDPETSSHLPTPVVKVPMFMRLFYITDLRWAGSLDPKSSHFPLRKSMDFRAFLKTGHPVSCWAHLVKENV
tara:strand:+ start:3768 stop:4139 length:372 start_codon:yes stop_codon:yes gene_type:complete